MSTSARRLCWSPVVAFALMASAMPAAAQSLRESIDGPKPFTEWSNSVHGLRDSLVALARAQVGTQYVRGGYAPNRGFDCSGLVRYVMAGLHVAIPRTAAEQARYGDAVDRDSTHLRPGDLLTFGKGKRGITHIGIYVGHGRYVHASSVAGRVIESDTARVRSPLIRPWRGVRRVSVGDDEATERALGDS